MLSPAEQGQVARFSILLMSESHGADVREVALGGPDTFRVGKRVYVHVDDDVARGRRLLDDALKRHYGGGEWSEHMFVGPAEECAEAISAVADAGAELILLNPLVDDAGQLERLAGELIPALSSGA